MYLTKIPAVLKWTFPGVRWDFPESKNELFLTFDDGPTEKVTPFVLEQLALQNAKATFFCLGSNAEKLPELVKRILDEGHAIGSHSYSHLDGWNTKWEDWKTDVDKGRKILEEITGKEISLFRPPYGRMKPGWLKKMDKDYSIIMWNLMTGDFDGGTNGEAIIKQTEKNVTPGSIIVMHDSEKAFPRLEESLPALLKKFAKRGLVLKGIDLMRIG